MNMMGNDMSLASKYLHLAHYFDVRQWFYCFIGILGRNRADDFLVRSFFVRH